MKKVFVLKSEGELFPMAFICDAEDEFGIGKLRMEGERKKLKEGETIVLCELLEINK